MTRHITGYYTFGGGMLDGKALENALGPEANLPIASVDYASSGGGGYTVSEGGMHYGTELHVIVDQDAGETYETALGMSYVLANVGYGLRLGSLLIVPLIGIGTGGIGLDVTPRPGTNAILSVLRMSRTNWLLHVGLGIHWHVGGRVGLTFGVRLGYLFAPFSKREGIQGPYIRGLFGAGTRNRR